MRTDTLVYLRASFVARSLSVASLSLCERRLARSSGDGLFEHCARPVFERLKSRFVALVSAF